MEPEKAASAKYRIRPRLLISRSIGLLLVSGLLSSCSSISLEALSAGVSVGGEVAFTDFMSVDLLDLQDATRGNAIVWHPVYTITNRTAYQLQLRDIDIDFASRVLELEGQRHDIDLVEKRAGQSVDKFRTSEELENNQPSEKLELPISIEPGEQVSIRLEEALLLTLDGQPIALNNSEQALLLLGPFFDLIPDGDGYRCVTGRVWNAVLEFDEGVVRRQIEQIVLPVGCRLLPPR